jgi:cell division protease FtsH
MQFRNNDDPSNKQNPPPTPDWQKWLLPALLLTGVMWFLVSSGSFFAGLDAGATTEVPYSTVRSEVEAGNIRLIRFTSGSTAVEGAFTEAITLSDRNGRSVSISTFNAFLPEGGAQQLLDLLAMTNVPVQAAAPQISILALVLNFLPLLLIIGFLFLMFRRMPTGNVFNFGKSKAREYNEEMPPITFSDVAGQDSAKQELIEVVDYLKNPNKYVALGAKVPRGVLLIGPPGTGKTLMARAVAGEAGVAYFSIAASEFVEMFVGVGASRVRDLFTRAKQNSPSIIFIDEIDAVGRRRGAGLGGGNDEREQTLNQMLSEMDGFDKDTSVIIMAATNRPDVLDPALLRPGRFDRQITVELPDRQGRLEILRIHTRDKPLSKGVDLEAMAKASVGFTGADLANLANEAALLAARTSRKHLIMADFTGAFERIMLGTKRPPLSNQEERRVVAYHEAGHALVAMRTADADPVLKVTISPRGQALGVTAFLPDDDRRNFSKRYLETRIRVMLGGRAAEHVVFDEVTTGAADDLKRVTDLAQRMVTQFGMTEALGNINFGENESQPFLGYTFGQGRPYSEETAAEVDREVRRIVDTAYAETVELVEAHREQLISIAEKLIEQEVLERAELLALLGIDETLDLLDMQSLAEDEDEDEAVPLASAPAALVDTRNGSHVGTQASQEEVSEAVPDLEAAGQVEEYEPPAM